MATSEIRFRRWMAAVDDELLEEAWSPVRTGRKGRKTAAVVAVAACLCVAIGLMLWRGLTVLRAQTTAEDLARYGYTLPLPEDARQVTYSLEDGSEAVPIAQANFTHRGHAVTLRALKTATPQDISGLDREWSESLDWSVDGIPMQLRADGQTAWIGWYSGETQWCVSGPETPAQLMDTVEDIFAALGTQLATAPEGAADIHYNAFWLDELAVGETTFTLDGVHCVYRVAVTYDVDSDFADISGVDDSFAHSKEAEVGWCPARLAWDEGGAGKLVWFDVVPGELFSLTVDSGATEQALLDLAGELYMPAQGEDRN